jgi:hypothetical protein
MKKGLILLVFCFVGFLVYAQKNTYSYNIIDDNPKRGNYLYAGLELGIKLDAYGPFGEIPIGPNIQFQNIYGKFGGSIYYNRSFNLFKSESNNNLLKVSMPGDFEITGIYYLLSKVKTKERGLTMRESGNTRIVTRLPFSVNNILGLRFGYHNLRTPIHSYNYAFDYEDSDDYINIYGFYSNRFTIGLSYLAISNFSFDTDQLGVVNNKMIKNLYFDIMLPISASGDYYLYNSTTWERTKVEFELPDSDSKLGIDFKFGYEQFTRNYSGGRFTIKQGIEFGTNSSFTFADVSSFYFVYKFGYIFSIK